MALRRFTKSFFVEPIPVSWRQCTLGCVITRSQYGLNEPAQPDGTLAIVGMKDIVDGNVNVVGLARINGNHADYTDYQLHPNDLLINRTNSYDLVGKTAIFAGGAECVYASYLVRLEPDQSQVNPQYLNLWLNHSIAQRALKRLATRAIGQANLNPTEVRKLCPLLLPPSSEQEQIVAVLSSSHRTIELYERQIVNSHAEKRALIQQLVWGKKRFPRYVRSGEMKNTLYGAIPEDWEFRRIGDFATEVSIRNDGGQDLPVLACSKHRGFVKSLDYFKKQIFSDDTSNYKLAPRGTFGFPANHIEEGSIGYQDICDTGLVSPIYCVFKTNGAACDGYLYRLFKSDHYRQIFSAATNSSVDRRGSLRWREFSRLRVPMPPLEEQEAISRVLDAIDARTANLQKQLESLRSQETALMQQLLTGKRRVKLYNEAAPVAVNG